MRWEAWVLMVWYALGWIALVSQIGKQRKPITPMDAISVCCLLAIFAYLIVRLGTA